MTNSMILRRIFMTFCLLVMSTSFFAQETSEADIFWNILEQHCGKAYKGTLVLPEEDPQFAGKELVMHIRSCEDNVIKIPFFVGDDRSRTWVLTKVDGLITLKHDHRHKDGSDDEITMYGGTATNTGKSDLQIFPADPATQKMIPAAAGNVWWITIDKTSFTYNLRRLGTDRVFKVVFDLQNSIETLLTPWGWKEE